jgi:MFS family permease
MTHTTAARTAAARATATRTTAAHATAARNVAVSAGKAGGEERGATRPRLWTRDLLLIILVNLCVFINHIMSLATFPFYIESLGGSEAVSGICAATFSLLAVVVRPFVGWWLDNGARRVVLIAGLLLMGLAPAGYMMVPVMSVAIAFRMTHGLGLSLSNSTTATVASDVICRPRFAEGMGYFGMATALASAIAPALGLFLMEGYGFGVLYGVAALVAGLALVLFSLVRVPRVDVPKSASTRARSSTRTAFPPRSP